MAITQKQTFQTGDECGEDGRYQFDGYLNVSHEPAPPPDERSISVTKGDLYPGVGMDDEPCYWRPEGGDASTSMRGSAPMDVE